MSTAARKARKKAGIKFEREEKQATPRFPRLIWKKDKGGIPVFGISNRSVKRIERLKTDGPVRSAHDRARETR